jgi:hypothetical protein
VEVISCFLLAAKNIQQREFANAQLVFRLQDMFDMSLNAFVKKRQDTPALR